MLQANPASHVVEIASGPLQTEYGEFLVRIFTDGKEQCAILELGNLIEGENVLCRLHSECLCSHVFFSIECDCSRQMRSAMEAIATAGRGLVIYLVHEGRSNGAAAHIATQTLKRAGTPQDIAYQLVGFPADGRDYAIAAKVIKFLDIASIALISASQRKRDSLQSLGIKVSDMRNDYFGIISLGPAAEKLTAPPYIRFKRNKMGRKVLVVGDIAVDYVVFKNSDSLNIVDLPQMVIGGTAINAATAMSKRESLMPIVFGRVGRDPEGIFVQHSLTTRGIPSLIGVDNSKRTASCIIVYGSDLDDRLLIKNENNNANTYKQTELRQAALISGLEADDYALIICHFMPRLPVEQSLSILRTIPEVSSARIILDLVPHNMFNTVKKADFLQFCSTRPFSIIGEWNTIAHLLSIEVLDAPRPNIVADLFDRIQSEWLVLRHGEGNIEIESRYHCVDSKYQPHSEIKTGYQKLLPSERRGFGDRLTAQLIEEVFQ